MDKKSIWEYTKKPISWAHSKISPHQRKINKIKKESGVQEGQQKANFNKIVKILNYDDLADTSIYDDSEISLKSDEYADMMREKFEGLKDNIEIVGKDESVEITIHNLYLEVLGNIDISSKKNFTASFDIHFYFKNNTFLCAENLFKVIGINLYGDGSIHFEYNKCENIGLNFYLSSSTLKSNNKNLPRNKYVKIKNNEIDTIRAWACFQIYFEHDNKIDKVYITRSDRENIFDIIWSPYQIIDVEEKNTEYNKNSFITLKKRAVEKDNKMQEFLFNREVSKCDYCLIKKDPFWDSWQDRFIMCLGKVVSNHGISWGRPAIGIIGINSILAITFYFTDIGCDKDFIYIFAEMFNPFSSLAQVMELDENINNGWVSFANVFQKVMSAVLIYELIRVAKRFTYKSK